MSGFLSFRIFQRRVLLVVLFSVWIVVFCAPASGDVNVGDIAVIETDATILQPGELFDLNNKSVTFTPRVGGGYTVTTGTLNFESTLGTNLGMIDDDSKVQPLSFSLPFFGTNYSSVFINSNGHLTFLASRPDDFHYNDLCGGDVANIFNPSLCPSAANVLDVAAEDVPRIAPLWQDWNPSAGGGVFARSLADRLVVTWSGVPLFGTGTTATFQVVLFNTGIIRMNYQSVTITPGGGYLVGISPGSSSPFVTTTIDFSQGLGSSISNCVLFGILCPNLEPLAQVFGSTPSPLVQIPAVARKFYQAHGDQIDQFVMFANFANAMGNAFAFELNINPDVAGIGLDPLNIASFYGSQGRLVSFLNMNRLALYPADPNAVFLAGDNSTLDLMGQEAGHNWLAFVNFDDGGVCSDLLLGRQLAHWSFFHDSDASDMEGNKWQDNGNGTFTSIEATERFSALDQYIMGLRSSSEVPNFFFIRNPGTVGCFAFDSTGERSCAPQIGVNVTGNRQDVTLSQIQTCEGLRSPSSGFSAANPTTTWRQAFILLIRGGTSAPQADIDKIDTIRSAWLPYFNAATSGRGFVDTSLQIVPDNGVFVRQQYLDFLDREPDPGGLSLWTGQLNSGLPRADLIEFFMNSTEFRFKGRFIAQTYYGILARNADHGGFRGWLAALLSGVSREQIIQGVLDSAEFQANFGSGLTNGQFVERMYVNVLQRVSDPGGFSFWVGQLDGGFMTRAQLALGFLDSEEFQNSQRNQNRVNVSLLYFDMLRRDPDAGGFSGWVGALDGGVPLVSVIDVFLNSAEYEARF